MSEILRYTLSNPYLLPTGYTPVAYIESRGSSYIDTELIPNSSTGVAVLFMYTSKHTSNYLGPLGTQTFNATTDTFRIAGITTRDAYGIGTSEVADTVSSEIMKVNQMYHVYMNTDNNGRFYINGKSRTDYIGTIGIRTFTSSAQSIWLFSRNNNGMYTSSYNFTGKIYVCKLWKDGTLVRNFIPCINSSNVAGMFDIVNQKFYSSKTSTAFIAGPSLPLLTYIWNDVGSSGNILDGITPAYNTTYKTVPTSGKIEGLTWNSICKVTKGTTITASFDVYGDIAGIKIYCFFYNNTNGYVLNSLGKCSNGLTTTSSDGGLEFPITTTKTRYWITWTMGNDTSKTDCMKSLIIGRIYYSSNSSYTGKKVYISNVKLHWGLSNNETYLDSYGIPYNLHSSTENPNGSNIRNDGSTYFNNGSIGFLGLPTFTNISISLWMKPSNTNLPGCLFNYRTSMGGDFAVFLVDGKIRFDAGGRTTFNYSYTTEWLHVVVTYDKIVKCLYIDGELKLSVSLTTDISCTATKGTIGLSSTNTITGSENVFNGCLYDFRIFDNALTAENIQAIYLAK